MKIPSNKTPLLDKLGCLGFVLFMACGLAILIATEPYFETNYGPNITVTGTVSKLEYQPEGFVPNGKFSYRVDETYIIYLERDNQTIAFPNVNKNIWSNLKEGQKVEVIYRQKYEDRKSRGNLLERETEELVIETIRRL